MTCAWQWFLRDWIGESAIEDLEHRLGKKWAAIAKARATTDKLVGDLTSVLADLYDPNLSVVVTGSLGRGEASADSDADWVLLVDGPSNPDHALIARTVDARIKTIIPKSVGATGTFAEMVVSHELVHYIAGARDTNENLTRRVLLLSESRSILNPLVRERVIRNILARYVVHDRSVPSRSGDPHKVPHFLLNDIVRYWRTMASDYASKMWERQQKEWGIRNIKLRFSRKLLFIWGLLASFSGHLFPTQELERAKDDEEYYVILADLIRRQTDVTPLELLARVAMQAGDDQISNTIFSAYDHFLEVICEPEARKKLESVRFEDAATDETYAELREVSGHFRSAVNELFFDKHPLLPDLVHKFGVF